MKLKKLFPIAIAFTLPLSVVSCGDEKEEKGTSSEDEKGDSGAKETVKAKSHDEVGKGVTVTMTEMITGMGGIKDLASAKAFAAKVPSYRKSLQGLADQAKELAPPTDEEKKAIQTMKAGTDALMAKTMMTLGPAVAQAPESKEINAVMEGAMNEEFAKTLDSFKQLYDLED